MINNKTYNECLDILQGSEIAFWKIYKQIKDMSFNEATGLLKILTKDIRQGEVYKLLCSRDLELLSFGKKIIIHNLNEYNVILLLLIDKSIEKIMGK